MPNDLQAAFDAALIANMHAGLRDAIDDAMAKGASRREILRRVKSQAGGRNLTVMTVEAYLRTGRKGVAHG